MFSLFVEHHIWFLRGDRAVVVSEKSFVWRYKCGQNLQSVDSLCRFLYAELSVREKGGEEMTRIRSWLKEEGRSVAWLSRKTGYSYQFVLEGIAGRRAVSPAFRERVAAVVGVPIEELFREDGFAAAA